MATEDVKRKLTAIFSADVQGYSRLMGDDERATVETITAYRRVMTDLIQAHHGSVKDAKGDNVLAEFTSVVDAIQCAVEIQKKLGLKNADLPEERRMAFRIGVNLGDVIEKEDTIYGDGVNIAARLESLAEGGGICISGTAFDQVGKKLPLGYKYMGEQKVKNIEKTIRTYRVLLDPESVGKVIGEKHRLKMWHWTAIFASIVLIGVAGGMTLWEFYGRPDVTPASIEKTAFPQLDKPSIAVLPFDNLSGDPEQEYFSDGMTDDIITDLSKISDLMVISRNSAFTYKGKELKIPIIAKELGVRYVLEGSVRRAGNEIRINAQLIDAVSDQHIWADRFDGKNENIFDLQDRITGKIVSALSLKLSNPEQKVITEVGTHNYLAYDEYLKGVNHMRKFTPKDYVKSYWAL
jgi:adenylate cyclase